MNYEPTTISIEIQHNGIFKITNDKLVVRYEANVTGVRKTVSEMIACYKEVKLKKTEEITDERPVESTEATIFGNSDDYS